MFPDERGLMARRIGFIGRKLIRTGEGPAQSSAGRAAICLASHTILPLATRQRQAEVLARSLRGADLITRGKLMVARLQMQDATANLASGRLRLHVGPCVQL